MEPEKIVSCKLSTPEFRARKTALANSLKSAVLQRRETEGGFTYEFATLDTNLQLLIDFVKYERECCEFFLFDLTIRGDLTTMSITGPPGTKQILMELAL